MIEDITTIIGYFVIACFLMAIPIITGVSLVAWRPEITACLFVVSFVEMIGIVVGLKELHDCCGKF